MSEWPVSGPAPLSPTSLQGAFSTFVESGLIFETPKAPSGKEEA